MKGRAWLFGILMALTALASVALRPKVDPAVQVRAAVPLESLFPLVVGAWQLDPTAVAPIRPAFERARQFQMYDQVLERTYADPQGRRIMLSVAYGRQQSVGLQMHRPEVCYRAGGFVISDVNEHRLAVNGQTLPVTRLLASMPGRPEPITYWRLLGEQVVVSESGFRLGEWRWGGGVLMDGLLVRVSSMDSDLAAAWQVQADFVVQLAAAMNPAQRRRVFGAD